MFRRNGGRANGILEFERHAIIGRQPDSMHRQTHRFLQFPPRRIRDVSAPAPKRLRPETLERAAKQESAPAARQRRPPPSVRCTAYRVFPESSLPELTWPGAGPWWRSAAAATFRPFRRQSLDALTNGHRSSVRLRKQRSDGTVQPSPKPASNTEFAGIVRLDKKMSSSRGPSKLEYEKRVNRWGETRTTGRRSAYECPKAASNWRRPSESSPCVIIINDTSVVS